MSFKIIIIITFIILVNFFQVFIIIIIKLLYCLFQKIITNSFILSDCFSGVTINVVFKLLDYFY